MPLITIKILQGYDDATKQRLLEGLSAVPRTVLGAHPDVILADIVEMDPAHYARGGQRRTPRPAPEPPEQIVRAYLAAMERRDLTAAAAYLAPDAELVFPGDLRCATVEAVVAWSAGRYQSIAKTYEGFETLPGISHTSVICWGRLNGLSLDGSRFEGVRFLDRFELVDSRITRQQVWNDLAEFTPRL